MGHLNSKVGQRIQWRRDKVREYSSIKRYTVREIAAVLKIPKSTVDHDLQSLRLEAKDNIQHYTDEILPAEYESMLDTLNLIIKEMWAIKPRDNRELMQSRTLIKDCCATRMELIASSTVIDRAVKFVERHKVVDLGRGLTDQNKEVVIDDGASRPQ